MDAQFAKATFTEDTHVTPDIAIKNRRTALFLWRIANGLIFVFFVFANYLMRSVQPVWPPPGAVKPEFVLPAVVSALLLASYFPAQAALRAIRRDDPRSMMRNLWIVLAIGTLFVVGVLITMLGTPYSGPYSSIVITMMGFHIFHAAIGMLLLAYAIWRAQAGAYTKLNHWTVEAGVVFWHFVDLMWVIFFIVIFLI